MYKIIVQQNRLRVLVKDSFYIVIPGYIRLDATHQAKYS